jgi:hypothetical protein
MYAGDVHEGIIRIFLKAKKAAENLIIGGSGTSHHADGGSEDNFVRRAFENAAGKKIRPNERRRAALRGYFFQRICPVSCRAGRESGKS